ncbi:MAG: hypothetical protein Q9163_002041 [Psora crenata]
MNYPLDIEYPTDFGPNLETAGDPWTTPFSAEMRYGIPGASCPTGENFAMEYETSRSLTQRASPAEMQIPWDYYQGDQSKHVEMITRGLCDRQCPPEASVPWITPGNCNGNPNSPMSDLRQNQAVTPFFAALPTQQEEDPSANTNTYFDPPTENNSDSQWEGSQSFDDSAPPAKTSRKKDRARHNVVEQRYRENLNTRIMQLRDRIPSLQTHVGTEDDASIRRTKRGTICKATVLIKAGEYIEHLQSQTMRLQHQNDGLERLVERLVAALEGESKSVDGRSTGTLAMSPCGSAY